MKQLAAEVERITCTQVSGTSIDINWEAEPSYFRGC
jgi:hypothetical protein